MTPKKKRDRGPTPPDRPTPAEQRPEEPDVVEEASEESFPASDTPSWSPLHTGKPGKHPDRTRR
jgi:hypothetical protein